jgi:hypothetical protein
MTIADVSQAMSGKLSLADIADAIQALATILAVMVAAWTIAHASRINKVNQIIEVWRHCALRGEALKEKLLECESGPGGDGKCPPHFWTNYWSRFWALKSDQFDFWLNGYLDHDTFCDWSFDTIKSIPHPDREPEQWELFDKGWKGYVAHGTAVANPLFSRFVIAMMQIAHDDYTLRLQGDPIKVEKIANRRRYDAMIEYVSTEIEGSWFNQKFGRVIPRKFAGEISWAEHTRLMQVARRREEIEEAKEETPGEE